MKKPTSLIKQPNITRRSLITDLSLASIGIAGAGLTGATALAGEPADGGSKYYTPGLPLNLPEEAGTLPRANFEHPKNFDLNDPHHLKLARLKVLNALDGSKTYYYTVARHIMCPPDKPPYPIFAELELTTIWLERREGMSDTQAIVRAIFTRAPVDPFTFKPITSFSNPYVGREMPLKYTHFAGGGFEVDLSGDTPADPIVQSDEPHYRIGDDIAFIMYDPRAGDGPFHPRMDTVTWRANYKDVMNRRKSTVEAEHTYTAVMKASVYDLWSGAEDGDPAQVVTSKTGRKVTSVEDLPQECHDYIVSKFPDRV